MDLYQLPQFKKPDFKFPGVFKNKGLWLVLLVIFLSSFFGFLAGLVSGSFFYFEIREYLSDFDIELPEVQRIIEKEYVSQSTQEELVIKAVKSNDPVVVSVIATKDVPVFEQQFFNPFEGGFEDFFQFQIPQSEPQSTQRQEVGGGTGFLVSEDGMVLTNKHVVLDKEADYTVFTNEGKKYPAEVLARDPFQDLAVLKIKQESASEKFKTVKLGDSDSLLMGQTVIAIGNALGEFRNTVSVGTVSGLGRTITASGGGIVETIEDVIQTDAAINRGNSGGPLLNLKGEVVGINTAMVQGAQSIGFAIPINKAKRAVEQVKQQGRIVYPFLGIRYVLVTESIKEQESLEVDYGALILGGDEGELAIIPGSAADKAGLRERDILLEFNGEKITLNNSLAKVIQKYAPGERVVLKILRQEKEEIISVVLGENSD